jgi:uncharacterized Zn-binding protein involved in type VI secretion
MRARHRHFNPINAGATFAWDTRFNVDGHTDGTSVATWTDRASQTATQSSSSRRPIWEDDATNNINGHPVVKFDGTNDKLDTASITAVTAISFVSVAKRPWQTAKYANIFGGGGYGATTGYSALSTGGAANGWQNKDFMFAGDGFRTGQTPRAIGAVSDASGTAKIISGVQSSSLSRVFFEGARMSTRSETTNSVTSAAGAFQIGGTTVAGQGDDAGDFSIATLHFWKDSEISAPVRKRLEHAAAFSFKISCN